MGCGMHEGSRVMELRGVGVESSRDCGLGAYKQRAAEWSRAVGFCDLGFRGILPQAITLSSLTRGVVGFQEMSEGTPLQAKSK